MTNEINSFPDDVLDALQQGQTLEAIKLLRTATGLGLKEAKDAIEAYQKGHPLTVPIASSIDQLPASVLQAIQSGNKIEAIKLLREQTGLGLKEAKDAVEAMPKRKAGGSAHFPTIEKPKAGNAVWWLVGAVALAFWAYYFFR